MLRNPRFGMHPDLFGGETPIYIPIESLSLEELATMKRSQFTPEELYWIERKHPDVYDQIVDNSYEEKTAALDKVSATVLQEQDKRSTPEAITSKFIEGGGIEEAAQNYSGEIARKLGLPLSEVYNALLDVRNWDLKVVIDNAREKGDWETNPDNAEITVDLSEFNLTSKEIYDVADSFVDAITEGNKVVIYDVPIPYKGIWKIRSNIVFQQESNTLDIPRYLHACLHT